MKLDFDQTSQSMTIAGYSSAGIEIGNRILSEPFVAHAGEIDSQLLPETCLALTGSHIGAVVELGVNIIIIGTGSTQRFLDINVLRPALENGVGVETMQTGAACRSYNVLVAEGRAVAGLFYPLTDVP